LGAKTPKRFNLIRWFSLASLAVITLVVVSVAMVSTRVLMVESVERDGVIVARSVLSIAEMERRHADMGLDMTMGALLEQGASIPGPEGLQRAIARTRGEFLDHITHLPDVLQVNLYTPDRLIFWSTDPKLIGNTVSNEKLEEAFESRGAVVASHFRPIGEAGMQGLFGPPLGLFLEHYIPLEDGSGRVAAMVGIHKEPTELIAHLQQGYLLFWVAAVFGGLLIYAGLFWMVWRLSGLLGEQQKQLVANETVVALGEMSTAVAHSLRNPLAAIRSSAELALDEDDLPVRRNIEDIVTQVDRLSKCVSELLISSRPLNGDAEEVDPQVVVADALEAFEPQLRGAGITVDWERWPAPAVVSHRLLFAQVLNSVISNAIEAMPRGGSLRVRMTVDSQSRHLRLIFSDTGNGMSPEQMAMVFKSFYTTKRGGLGVGLVLARRIMERFGGSVELDSRERVGTDMCLIFRIAKGQ